MLQHILKSKPEIAPVRQATGTLGCANLGSWSGLLQTDHATRCRRVHGNERLLIALKAAPLGSAGTTCPSWSFSAHHSIALRSIYCPCITAERRHCHCPWCNASLASWFGWSWCWAAFMSL